MRRDCRATINGKNTTPELIVGGAYRVHKQAQMQIALTDQEAEIAPCPRTAAATGPSPSWTG